jgi:putative oxidoreductase
MKNHCIINLSRTVYRYLVVGESSLQPVFLFIVRLYWGWQFFRTGMGKLGHIDNIANYFQSLGIPFPMLNAYLAGSTECFGGLCLLFGIASRLITIPLIFTMIIAYVTAEHEALHNIFSNPDKFTSADPFLFMLTAVIVMIFGPGVISIDALLKKIFFTPRTPEMAPPAMTRTA